MEGHAVVAPAATPIQTATQRQSLTDNDNNWWLPKASLKQFLTSLTFLLVLAQLVIFVFAVALSEGFVPPSLNATFGPSRCGLIALGAKFSPFIVHKLEYWRILSANFIHSGVVTLIVSCLLEFLLVFPVEIENGKLISLSLFLISGATGYTFSCVANPTSVDTGALPSIMGFVGFRLADNILDWPMISAQERRRVGALEAGAAFVTLIVGQSPFVDNYASFAGFIMGCFIGGAYFAKKVDAPPPSQRIVVAMAILAAVFVMFVCSFLLAAGRFPLIDQVLWTTVCAPPSDDIYYIPLAGDSYGPDPDAS